MENEKIYCFDKCGGGDNNAALWAAAMSNKEHSDPMAMAAMMNGGMGNQWNNPFIYLVWMMFAQRMWGNDWQNHRDDPQYGYNALSNQIASFQTRMQDNHNTDLLYGQNQTINADIRSGFDKMSGGQALLQQTLCDVQAGISKLEGVTGFTGERIINAINLGDCGIKQQLADCCCTVRTAILEQGYQNQLANQAQTNTITRQMCDDRYALTDRIDFVNRSIERGFAASSFETQRQTCDIIAAGNANTQRIIDTLNNKWQNDLSQALQDEKFKNSQLQQNIYFRDLVEKGNGCGCGCNN